MYPPHDWLSWVSGSPRVGSKKHDRRNEPLNVWTPIILVSKRGVSSYPKTDRPATYENKAMAKSTKYATLASSGRAVLSERMMVCNPR